MGRVPASHPPVGTPEQLGHRVGGRPQPDRLHDEARRLAGIDFGQGGVVLRLPPRGQGTSDGGEAGAPTSAQISAATGSPHAGGGAMGRR